MVRHFRQYFVETEALILYKKYGRLTSYCRGLVVKAVRMYLFLKFISYTSKEFRAYF